MALLNSTLIALDTWSMDSDGTPDYQGRPPEDRLVLKCLSISLGFLSLVVALVSYYMFLKMRRRFWHDLLLLLIQGDLLKSLWLVVFPIVSFAHGPVASSSPFCQVSGFLLSLSIEACDAAILLIAIHSALYMFRPKRSDGEYGLYPYRRVAYVFYAIFPLVTASLGFLDGGFQNTGEYCYLAVRGRWYRTYLSWLPRYVIFGIISFLAVSMYLYVRILLQSYTRRSSSAQYAGQAAIRGTHTPPKLQTHGLLPSPPRSCVSSQPTRGRNMSVGSTSEDPLVSASRRGSNHTDQDREMTAVSRSFEALEAIPQFKACVFAKSPTVERMSDDIGPTDTSTSLALPRQPVPVYSPTQAARRASASDACHRIERNVSSFPSCGACLRPMPCPDHRRIDTANTANTSLRSLITTLRWRPERASEPAQQPSPRLNSQISPLGGLDTSAGMANARHKARRDLRLLFVIPTVYMVMWIVPLVCHILGFDDADTTNDAFWMVVLSMISLSLQGTVDGALLMAKERPWRDIRTKDWTSCLGRMRVRLWPERRFRGRSRQEMQDDERLARRRRAEEQAQENAERMQRDRANSEPSIPTGSLNFRREGAKGGQYWWEASRSSIMVDGADEYFGSDTRGATTQHEVV